MDVQTWHVSDDVQRWGRCACDAGFDGCLLKRYGDDREQGEETGKMKVTLKSVFSIPRQVR